METINAILLLFVLCV